MTKPPSVRPGLFVLLDIDEADVPLSSLDPTDVRSIQVAGKCQRYLRQPLSPSQITKALAESRLHGVVGFAPQATIRSPMATLGPRTLSPN